MYEDTLDKIVGILHVKQVVALQQSGEVDAERLRELLRPAYFVPMGTPLLTQLTQFQSRGERMALVVDEYGEIKGLTTIEDIIEEIIGEFTTTAPGGTDTFRREADGSVVVDGVTQLRTLNRRLGTRFPLDGPKTLNGLIVEQHGDIPDAGMTFRIAGQRHRDPADPGPRRACCTAATAGRTYPVVAFTKPGRAGMIDRQILCEWNSGGRPAATHRRRLPGIFVACHRVSRARARTQAYPVSTRFMATHAATRNLSGLARALAQQGLVTEGDADAIQSQAAQSGITFVEQLLQNKRMTPPQLAVFASRAFGVPLFDLSAFDLDQIQKDLFDPKMAATRRVLPLSKRGNRLFVAVSDPANLQALEEVRFKTNLVPEPLVVEDDKLGEAIAKLVDSSGANLKEMAKLDDLEIDLQDGAHASVAPRRTRMSRTRRSSSTSRRS